MSERSSLEAYLREHGVLTYPIVGVSMRPLLRQDRDIVTIERSPGRCSPGDVVLFRYGGRYVLHRVVEAREKDYVILGDNCVNFENGVTDADILGVMTRFTRGGREHTADDPPYRLYTRWILRTMRPRILWKKTIRHVRAVLVSAARKLSGREHR